MPDEIGPAHPRHTVLLIEDSVESREALQLLLEVEGFNVVTASDGVQALHLVRADGLRPCIVLLDLVIPLLDGLNVRRQLHATPGLERVPVVALTGHEGLRKQAEAEGFFRALLKPTGIDELVELVGQHCPRDGDDAHAGSTALRERG